MFYLFFYGLILNLSTCSTVYRKPAAVKHVAVPGNCFADFSSDKSRYDTETLWNSNVSQILPKVAVDCTESQLCAICIEYKSLVTSDS